jgi:flagellin-like hook-associated protein FlgL
MSQITLTAAMRANLVSLQNTNELMGRTQERLATGLKVNSAVDNPTNYFTARAHNQRADLLNGLKDYISEAIQTVKAADNGVKAITSVIENLRSIVNQARNALNDPNSGTLLGGLASQYNEAIRQLNNFQADASYKGVNFLTGSTSLTVNFNENASTSLTMNGFNATASGLAISGGTASGAGNMTSALMDTAGELDTIETSLNSALATLRTRASELAANLSVLTYRQSFITDMVNTLKDGATKLTVADTNEEGANMLMLQTRQQLGVTSLSLASQAAQSVLRLF